jgi:16S rRNA (cytidine1402-2'-O)-methyltransferase
MDTAAGTLYCVPTPIAAGREPADDLPGPVVSRIATLEHIVAESAKTARAFLKRVPGVRPIQQVRIVELNERTRDEDIGAMLAPLLAGQDVGLMSEAGCPGVADPGARLVRAAHRAAIPVVPLVGPSALLLALMGCGLEGQRFMFVGYLPAEAEPRRRRLCELEQRSRRERETVLFIETPYRNQAMADALLTTLRPSTWLCVAADLTGHGQRLRTDRVQGWRERGLVLARVPTVFLLLAD